jgi:hypothetical protein
MTEQSCSSDVRQKSKRERKEVETEIKGLTQWSTQTKCARKIYV